MRGNMFGLSTFVFNETNIVNGAAIVEPPVKKKDSFFLYSYVSFKNIFSIQLSFPNINTGLKRC